MQILLLLVCTLALGVVLKVPHIYQGERFYPSGSDNEALDDEGNPVELPKGLRQTLEERQGRGQEQTGGDTTLEDDFPHVDILKQAGFDTVEDLLKVEQYTEIEGIGEAKAKDVKDGVTKVGTRRKPQTGEEAES